MRLDSILLVGYLRRYAHDESIRYFRADHTKQFYVYLRRQRWLMRKFPQFAQIGKWFSFDCELGKWNFFAPHRLYNINRKRSVFTNYIRTIVCRSVGGLLNLKRLATVWLFSVDFDLYSVVHKNDPWLHSIIIIITWVTKQDMQICFIDLRFGIRIFAYHHCSHPRW